MISETSMAILASSSVARLGITSASRTFEPTTDVLGSIAFSVAQVNRSHHCERCSVSCLSLRSLAELCQAIPPAIPAARTAAVPPNPGDVR